MRKAIVLAILIGAAVFYFKNRASVSDDVAFSGSWVHTLENGLTGSKDTSTFDVVTDGIKFRLTEKQPSYDGTSYEVVTVYNGETIQTKFPKAEFDAFDEPSESNDDPQTPTPVKPSEVASRRFWRTAHMATAEAGPGGNVAGQDTVLYQMRENRPDATLTIQRWVDAKHKILLKSSISIYAKQVESLMSKETYECQSIQFGPVDPALLEKP